MRQIDRVPDGWYSTNRIWNVPIAHNVRVFRTENRGGQGLFGLIEYKVSIDNVEAPIPQSYFETLAGMYPERSFREYLYLDENCDTYRVYESKEGIFTEK